MSILKATLKKKFVSCPVGGHNCGQSRGRKIFSFFFFFSPLYRNGRINAGEKSGNMKKKSAYPALIGSPGRWTGNKIIFKGGLIFGIKFTLGQG